MNAWQKPNFKRGISAVFLTLLLPVLPLRADPSLSDLLAQGDLAGQHGDVSGAMKLYAGASRLAFTNSSDLCRLTKGYCDLMHFTSSPGLQQTLAGLALTNALRAEQADPKNATAHLCVAVGYVKNFPYAANATKVRWSKAIKNECETAIALDPRQDVGYYLLGRWNFGVANMNFLLKGLVDVVYGGLPAASNAAAVRNFQKAIQLAPNRIIHHAELAKVYAAMGEKKLARAELEKCRDLKPVDRDDADAQQAADHLLSTLH